MSLNREFLNQLSNNRLKTNVVLVFTPSSNPHFSLHNDLRPNTNPVYDGAESFVFWKHEPDIVTSTFETIFNNHLTNQIGKNVPLNCVERVSIAGSEIDLKDANTVDDSVSVDLILQDVKDKSFFQELMGYTVEIYFGFSDDSFLFENYERFYIGKLNSLNSSSNLGLTLKMGTKADYWNSTWRHSKNLTNKRLAFDYPLPKTFELIDFDGAFRVIRPPESFFKFATTNPTKWGFDYNYRYLPNLLGGSTFQNFVDSAVDIENTSALFFEQSGRSDETPGKGFGKAGRYPDLDTSFANARGAPNSYNRIRFKIGDKNIESNYIDSFVMFPRILAPTNPDGSFQSRNPALVGANLDLITSSDMLMDVKRLDSTNPQNTLSQSLTQFNRAYIARSGGIRTGRTQGLRLFTHDYISVRNVTINNRVGNVYGLGPLTYNLKTPGLSYDGMVRFEFATNLKFFTTAEKVLDDNGNIKLLDGQPIEKPLEFNSGDEVKFYDLDTGIGYLNSILVETLVKNMGIDRNLIDENSFFEASERYGSELLGSIGIRFSGVVGLYHDYSSHSGIDGKDLIENKILKSTNLRITHEGGVLKCQYLDLEKKEHLKDDQDNPFLIHEDDLLQSVVYETREEDHIRRLKINMNFKDLEDNEPGDVVYALDLRSQDKTKGQILIVSDKNFDAGTDDFEEVNIYTSPLGRDFSNIDKGRNARGFLNRGVILNTGSTILPPPSGLATIFAKDYFNVLNPSIKMTLVVGSKGLMVNVGDLITVRDHDAFELFGSQFVKVLITNKSVSDWGTDNIQITLDCLFIETSEDYLSVDKDITPPKNLRLVSKTRNVNNPNGLTDLSIAWDAPDEWGVDKDSSKKYKFKELTSAGSRTLLGNLPFVGSLSNDRFIYSPGRLRFSIENGSTYHYQVFADNTVQESKGSNVLTVDAFDTVRVPSAPLNLRATVSPNYPRRVTLTWDEPADNGGDLSLSYQIFLNDTLDIRTGGNLSYTYNFSQGGRRCFNVRARNSAGVSPLSNQVCVFLEEPTPLPQGSIVLQAIAADQQSIFLSWDANITAGNENIRYEVYRDTVLMATISGTSFTDIGLEASTRYCYRVVALNDTGPGVQSNQDCATTLARVIFFRPDTVQNLSASNITKNSFDVTWDEPLSDGGKPITGYKIGVSTDNVNFVTTTQTTLRFSHTSLSPNTNYFVRVAAVNEVGDSPYSQIEVTTLPNQTFEPDAPTISASQTDDLEVTVNVGVADYQTRDVTSVVIEKSSDNVTFAVLETITSVSDNVDATDDSVVASNSYYYRAKTVNSVGDSNYSATVKVDIIDCASREAVIGTGTARFKDASESVRNMQGFILFDSTSDADGEGTPNPCGPYVIGDPEDLSKVRNLRTTDLQDTQATIAWDAPLHTGGYAISGYDVLYNNQISRYTSEGVFLQNLTASTSYTIQVRAVNALGTIGPYKSLTFRTNATPPPVNPSPPGKPTNVRIQTSHSGIEKTIAWDAPNELGSPNLDNYVVEYTLTLTDLTYAPLSTRIETGNTDNFKRILFIPYNTVRIRVAGKNSNGIGPFSDYFSFTTPEALPHAPYPLSVRLINGFNADLKWTAQYFINGAILYHTVYYRELLSGSEWNSIRVADARISFNQYGYVVTGLSRGKTYEFNVSRTNSVGEGPLSDTVNLSIPSNVKPLPVGITCRITTDNQIQVKLTPTGDKIVYRFRLKITVPGQSEAKFLYLNYNVDTLVNSFTVDLNARILALFSLTSLPSGTYTIEAAARNSSVQEFSNVTSASRCTVNYTTTAARAKAVSNIVFSKANNKLNISFTEPTDTGVYAFEWTVNVTENGSGTRFVSGSGTANKTNPNAATQTVSVDLTSSQFSTIFDNKTIVATVVSRKTGSLETISLSKTQVYEDVVMKANAPNVDSVDLLSNDTVNIQFDYPTGDEPITNFKVYRVNDGGINTLVTTITNNFAKNQKNIIRSLGSTTYTVAGTYNFYMVSTNSAGDSVASNIVSFTVAEPTPPAPLPIPLAVFITSAVRSTTTNRVTLFFDWPFGGGPQVDSFKIYERIGGVDTLLRTVTASSVGGPPKGGVVVSTTKTYTTQGTYYFAIRASNSSGDSLLSNIKSLVIGPAPAPVPAAPLARRVELNDNDTASIVFDYSRGAEATQFKIYEVINNVNTHLRTINAVEYTLGQTSIRELVNEGKTYTDAGTYSFYVVASNANGDSARSNTVSFTIAAPRADDAAITRVARITSPESHSGLRIYFRLAKALPSRSFIFHIVAHLLKNSSSSDADQSFFSNLNKNNNQFASADNFADGERVGHRFIYFSTRTINNSSTAEQSIDLNNFKLRHDFDYNFNITAYNNSFGGLQFTSNSIDLKNLPSVFADAGVPSKPTLSGVRASGNGSRVSFNFSFDTVTATEVWGYKFYIYNKVGSSFVNKTPVIFTDTSFTVIQEGQLKNPLNNKTIEIFPNIHTQNITGGLTLGLDRSLVTFINLLRRRVAVGFSIATFNMSGETESDIIQVG